MNKNLQPSVPEDARNIATRVSQLLSFSEVALRVTESVSDGLTSADTLGHIIEQDPALTASLLRASNAAFTSGHGAVDTVAKAVVVLGSDRVHELAMGICAATTFNKMLNRIISLEAFWQHSIRCAVSAKLLAASTSRSSPPTAFTIGLLHDMGQLVLFHEMPTESTAALKLSRSRFDGENLYLAERELWGFDHMDVGRSLAEQWNFPTEFVNSIGYHHCPFEQDTPSDTAVLIHVATGLAAMAEYDEPEIDGTTVDARSWDQLGLGPEDAAGLSPEVQLQTARLLEPLLSIG